MVKYADSPALSVSLLVDATPAALWPVISDIATPAQFENELQRAEWIEPATGPALGATFRGYNEHLRLGFEWQVECRVDWCTPDQEFGWTVLGDSAPVAAWKFTLEPGESDRTRLGFWARMGPGPSGLTPAIEAKPDREDDIVANRLDEWRQGMTATLEGIKRQAEG